jgi:hypothetical protein
MLGVKRPVQGHKEQENGRQMHWHSSVLVCFLWPLVATKVRAMCIKSRIWKKKKTRSRKPWCFEAKGTCEWDEVSSVVL